MGSFRQLRKNAGYTQKELAEMIGVAERTVRNWENAETEIRLTPRQTMALCQALGVSLKELISLTP